MSDFRNKFSLPSRYKLREKNLWIEYFELARKYNPIDLGIGSPDFPPPDFVKDALVEVANTTNNEIHQYTRGANGKDMLPIEDNCLEEERSDDSNIV